MNRRQEIIDYVRGKYGADIEYLWMRYPSYANDPCGPGKKYKNTVGGNHIHMNTNQYWAKMDRVFDSKSLSSVQKSEELAKVLKTGYEQNLDILCVCNETEEGQAHQMYVNLDEGNPLSVGNRYMLCYTGHSRAIHDTHAPMYPKAALILEISTRDMLNNLFNKRVIGGLIFNRYLSNAIIIHKPVLERYIKGDKPLPPTFLDTPMPYPLEYPHDITPEMLDLMHQFEKAMDEDPDGFKKFMAKMARDLKR